MSNTLRNDNHISKLGRKLGPLGITWLCIVPAMLMATLVMVVAMAAPADIRPALAVPMAIIGVLAFVAGPLWYYRGKARWIAFGVIMGVLGLCALLHYSMLAIVAALA